MCVPYDVLWFSYDCVCVVFHCVRMIVLWLCMCFSNCVCMRCSYDCVWLAYACVRYYLESYVIVWFWFVLVCMFVLWICRFSYVFVYFIMSLHVCFLWLCMWLLGFTLLFLWLCMIILRLCTIFLCWCMFLLSELFVWFSVICVCASCDVCSMFLCFCMTFLIKLNVYPMVWYVVPMSCCMYFVCCFPYGFAWFVYECVCCCFLMCPYDFLMIVYVDFMIVVYIVMFVYGFLCLCTFPYDSYDVVCCFVWLCMFVLCVCTCVLSVCMRFY